MSSSAKPVMLWDRDQGKAVEEFMPDHRATYETHPRRSLIQWLQSTPLYDRRYALYQDASWTTRQIEPFAREYHIDVSEFEPRQYRSYADFFVREFKPGARRFPDAPAAMGAPVEGRYFGWERFGPEQRFPVKGQSLAAAEILGGVERTRPFLHGPVILARLSPVDYHHVHYPDDGRTVDHERLGRRIWMVAWKALQAKPDIYIRNERQVNILGTRHFGRLGFVEFVALTVGRIVQCHSLDQPFRRGAQKAVFKFAGSAMAIFGEPGAWRPGDDILDHTPQGMKTIVRLGEPVAAHPGGDREALRQGEATGGQLPLQVNDERHRPRDNSSMTQLPQPTPQPAPVPEPDDVPYGGALHLVVDATDVMRRIYQVRETIPVPRSGPMVLLYPKWLPGFHAPQAPIELFAGLVITAGSREIAWRRHPVTINAFLIEIPDGISEIEAAFQFLSPTDPSQGRVIVTPEMLALQWNTVVLYPAGHFARQIEVEASLTVPDGWRLACALEQQGQDGRTTRFKPVPLDVLVDSPLFAGRHFRRITLDVEGTVRLNLVADRPELLEAKPEQIAPHRALVAQCDRLFGARHFDHYEMLLALSDEMTGIGVEHHRSFDAVTLTGYFTAWDETFARRDTVPHEFVHSWNGKHRKGADSWSPCFELLIRNSLMWVYEGQTQYWSRVLCARSGLWSVEQALGALAQTAATYDARPGSRWRPTIDTTRDPIIAARSPLPWTSWQRSEDYYSEGSLIWLDVDTRLRELSGDSQSLDDFARDFFGRNEGEWRVTDTYEFGDIVKALDAIAPFDWASYFVERLEGKRAGTELDGLERGGYRLVYRDEPNLFSVSSDAVFGTVSLSFSLGVTLDPQGKLKDVLWEGPAFDAGLTAGSELVAVNGRTYDAEVLKQAIAAGTSGEPIELVVKTGRHVRTVAIAYDGGPRYPHLERIEGARPRLDEILAPLR